MVDSLPSFRGASQRVRAKRGPMTGSASEPGIQKKAPSLGLDSGSGAASCPGMTGDLRPQFQHKTEPPKGYAAALGGVPGDGGWPMKNLSVLRVTRPAGGTIYA
jgi:hypothetical protein